MHALPTHTHTLCVLPESPSNAPASTPHTLMPHSWTTISVAVYSHARSRIMASTPAHPRGINTSPSSWHRRFPHLEPPSTVQGLCASPDVANPPGHVIHPPLHPLTPASMPYASGGCDTDKLKTNKGTSTRLTTHPINPPANPLYPPPVHHPSRHILPTASSGTILN